MYKVIVFLLLAVSFHANAQNGDGPGETLPSFDPPTITVKTLIELWDWDVMAKHHYEDCAIDDYDHNPSGQFVATGLDASCWTTGSQTTLGTGMASPAESYGLVNYMGHVEIHTEMVYRNRFNCYMTKDAISATPYSGSGTHEIIRVIRVECGKAPPIASSGFESFAPNQARH